MDLLQSLHIANKNSGASAGPHWWSRNKSDGEIISLNPTDGKPIASVYRPNNKDYEFIIKEAQQAFVAWRTLPAPKRGEIVRCLGEELRRNKDFLGSLVSLEMGKSKQEGDGEVQEMIDMADFAVGQSRMLYGKTMHSERFEHRMYEQWHPLGIVAIISAFNFPVAVWAWNAFIAAICGNVCIWKPSPKTSLCAIAVQQICNRVLDQFGYRGVFSLLVTDDNNVVKNIASDPRIALFSFTGSSAVGQELGALVAKHFGRSILELSGNNAIVIDKSANLKLALPAVLFGAIGTAGQRCTTTRRLFIHQAIYKKFVSSLVKAYEKISIGDPLDQKNQMGPLIDQHAVAQFTKTIDTIKRHGGKILFGGNVIKRPGFFVEPTLASADPIWDVVQRETFAPILYVMPFASLDEAITLVNSSFYGLSSSLFTQDLIAAETFLSTRGSDCGIANINIGTSGAEIGGAFGGEKATGAGREAGSDAWQAYMRRQTNTINWSKDLPLAQGIKFEV